MGKEKNQEYTLKGIAISPGIAFAPIHVTARGKLIAPESYQISEKEISQEIKRFTIALEKTKDQIGELHRRVKFFTGENEAKIFEAHLIILEDKSLIKKIKERIKKRRENAETAFYAVIENYLEALRRVSDPYLKQRTADIEDISKRILDNINLTEETLEHENPDHQYILMTYEILPSQVASLNRSQILAIITEQGGDATSHSAILSRSLNIPAVGNLQNDSIINIKTLSPCIVDGYSGKVIINPTQKTLLHYKDLENQKLKKWIDLGKLRTSKPITTDGIQRELSANIEFTHELTDVSESGATGVGLFRTEFLLLESFPNEEQQTSTYSLLAEKCKPHRVLIRTLDAGGDKLNIKKLEEPEPNPFLGWRGIRVSLEEKDYFKTQIKALLRAGKKGNIGITLPLISTIEEIQKAKQIIEECKQDLQKAKISFSEEFLLGVMIEVPAAALISEHMAQYVDYFSIGTNDLIQYTMAADRINPLVSDIYQETNPAVIKLIKLTIENGNKRGIWTSICGEMAGNLALTPLLLGLGIESLSTNTHKIPQLKQAIRQLSFTECQKLAEKAIKLETAEEIYQISLEMAQKAYPNILSENL